MACKIEGIVKVLHTVETISRARLLQKVNSGTPHARFARARGRRPIVYLPIRENLVIGAVRPRSPARPSAPQAYRWLSHFLACSGAQEKTDCTSMLWSIDSCQNRVSADQYHLTVSRAQVSTHRGRVFFEVIRWQVTSFQMISGSSLFFTKLVWNMLCLCHFGPALFKILISNWPRTRK